MPVGKRLILSPGSRNYLKEAETSIRQQQVNLKLEGDLYVEMAFVRPDKRRRDLDDYVKLPWDACTYGGVWLDDSQVVAYKVCWYGEIGKPGGVMMLVKQV